MKNTRQIELTGGGFAIVDEDDYEDLTRFEWIVVSPSRNISYAGRFIYTGSFIYMHRQIKGLIESDIHVDHINHNGLDNRKENLRTCTRSENLRNRRLHSNSTSGYIGVGYRANTDTWRVRVQVNGKSFYGGDFKCKIEAAKARDKMAIEYHGEFANLNFKQ